ncbi:MAG: AAA family ATPase [Candidatus Firestonebacteria bacterium]
MRLKKLELYSFKSFANKTEIVFEPGITCIVGPNGVGKSNIVDAIRWVLGEQSAKSLRTNLMEHCIFDGTDYRKPLGMAEVSLEFSELKGQLALNFEEVRITRRIFRNAECEYFINNSPSRLKDITEFLLDSGIGADTYFIMEQGKMDAILSSKPVDRRAIFEEAAGISKYKLKKEEALRKLEQAEQNSVRVKDIIAEVKRQVNSLERYAKKAEKYKKLTEELKEIEISLKGCEYNKFSEGLNNLTKIEESLKKEVTDLQNNISSEEIRLKDGRIQLLEEEKNLNLKQEEFYKLANEINNIFNKINLLDEKKEGLVKNIDDINFKVLELDKKEQNIIFQIENTKKEYDETVKSLSFEKENINKQTEITKVVKEKFKDNEKALKELRIEIFDIINQGLHLKNEIKNFENKENELKYKTEKITKKIEELIISKNANESKLLEFKKVFPGIGETGNFTSVKGIYEYTSHEIKNIEGIEKEINSHFKEVEKGEDLSFIRSVLNKIREKWGNYVSKIKPLFLILQDVEGVVAKKQEEQNVSDEMERIDKEIKLQNLEGQQIQEELKDIKGGKETAIPKLNEVQNKQKENEEKIKRLEDEINSARKSEEEDNTKWTDFKVRLTFLEQKDINLNNEISRLKLNLEEIEVNKKSFYKEIQDKSQQKNYVEIEIETLNKFLKETNPKKAELENNLAEEKKNNEEIRKAFYKDEENLREYRKAYEEKQRTSYETSIKINELSLKSKNCKEQILRDYNIDLTNYKSEKDYLKDNNISIESALVKTEEIKHSIEEIGPVNLVAMEEFEELQHRLSYLTNQEKDLVESKQSLIKTIHSLNQISKELFLETFTKVKNNFNEVFRKLFNGGHADLILIDENNLLETGIEIIAWPQGKRPKDVSLLSGGEKALTAIGLLFAVFMVKPSPFCILDEIDAPLDDSNVIRFRDMLKNTFSNVQFLIVTHNKLTMEIADVLYGVTQAEPGVSQVLSYKLKEESLASKPAQIKEQTAV